MLNVLVVDDEYLIRQKLKNTVPWSELGYGNVFDASDGVEAVEIIKDYHPDIVIADIRMPGMDGLELTKYINRECLSTKVILLTGYSEFEYAKSAIELKVYDYILKPIDSENLKNVLLKLQKEIKQEKNRENQYKYLQEYLNESLPQLKEKFFGDLLYNHLDEKEIKHKIDYYHITIDKYMVILVQADEQYNVKIELDEEIRQLNILFIKQTIIKLFGNVLIHVHGDYIFILYSDTNIEYRNINITQKLLELQNCIEEEIGFTISIGVSSTADTIGRVKLLCREAIRCLEYKFYNGPKSLIFIEDIQEKKILDISMFDDIINKIYLSIRLGKSEDAQKNISELLKSLKLNSDIEISFAKNVFFEIAIMVYRIQCELFDYTEEIIRKSNNIYNIINKSVTLDEIEKHLIPWLMEICRSITSLEENKMNILLKQVYKFIEENYDKNIGLEQIAEYLKRNPSYISRLIKKETGFNFTDLLTKHRIQKAKKLLVETTYKIHEIASMTGYTNVKYFSRVFKDVVGMNAEDYRKYVAFKNELPYA